MKKPESIDRLIGRFESIDGLIQNLNHEVHADYESEGREFLGEIGDILIDVDNLLTLCYNKLRREIGETDGSENDEHFEKLRNDQYEICKQLREKSEMITDHFTSKGFRVVTRGPGQVDAGDLIGLPKHTTDLD
jgi:hypothetical protein